MSTNSTSSWTRKRRNFVWNRYFSLPAREDSFFASCRAAWKGFAQCKGFAQSSVRERGCSLECLRKFTAECERSKHSSSSSASARPESLPCNASRTEPKFSSDSFAAEVSWRSRASFDEPLLGLFGGGVSETFCLLASLREFCTIPGSLRATLADFWPKASSFSSQTETDPVRSSPCIGLSAGSE